jgi:hypothetical protein
MKMVKFIINVIIEMTKDKENILNIMKMVNMIKSVIMKMVNMIKSVIIKMAK